MEEVQAEGQFTVEIFHPTLEPTADVFWSRRGDSVQFQMSSPDWFLYWMDQLGILRAHCVEFGDLWEEVLFHGNGSPNYFPAMRILSEFRFRPGFSEQDRLIAAVNLADDIDLAAQRWQRKLLCNHEWCRQNLSTHGLMEWEKGSDTDFELLPIPDFETMPNFILNPPAPQQPQATPQM